MKNNKIIAFLLALSILPGMNCFAEYSSENSTVIKKTVHTISPGLDFIRTIETCDGIRQEIFTFEYTPQSDTAIVPAYGNYLYGFNSVGKLISSYDGEGRAVGGINTDFFITSTGVPLSCLVAEREIISSCDNRVAMGFDREGNAHIGFPDITAEIVSADGTKSIPVAHINKTPDEWGAYLVTDTFYSSTKSGENSIEIVFMPFDYQETLKNFTVTSTAQSPVVDEDGELLSENLYSENNSDNVIPDETESEADVSYSYITNDFDLSPDMYVYTEDSLEVVESINVVVSEIRTGVSNGEIPEGGFVLCFRQDKFDYLANEIEPGDEFIIKTSINDDFLNDINIFGGGTQIIKDGVFVPQEKSTLFTSRHPRTAGGIKEDGKVVFICVDGRNAGVSSGYTIKELADYMIEMGCVDAINFDGGGSTTFYAADIGELNAVKKNTPSDGFERRVADGLIFVNTLDATNIPELAAVYPSDFFVYNNKASIKIDGKVLFADSNFYPVEYSYENPIFTVDESFGTTEDNIFYPNGTVGSAPIFIHMNDENTQVKVGEIIVTDSVEELTFKAETTILNPFQNSTPLSIKALIDVFDVNITPESAEYTITVKNENDNLDEYTTINSDDAYIDTESFSFVPIKRDNTYFITASLGGVSETISVFVQAHPFNDMNGHWASEIAYELYNKGIFKGELSGEERSFFPERSISRVEFCTVLARILNLETDIVTDINNTSEDNSDEIVYTFEDVPEWAVGSVYSLYSEGYLDDMLMYDENGNYTMNSQAPATRMDIIRLIGKIIKKDEIEIDDNESVFVDFESNNYIDYEYLYLVSQNGIINGYEDGTVKQWSNLTRSEAAAVVKRLNDFINTHSVSE